MKYVKMLGLAAVAALALMAFLGAGSASATVLCKTAASPCGSEWLKTGSLSSSLVKEGSSVLKSTGGAIEDTCSASTTGGSITSQGENQPVVGSVNELTFTECTNTTTVLNQNGTLELEGETVSAKGFEVTVVAAGVSCVYSAGTGTTLGTFTGGNPAIIHINAVVNKKSGSFLCPSDSKWEGTYQITGVGTLHSEPK